jgi:acetylornithine/N-succinyldiaminopimelate aminotransferase
LLLHDETPVAVESREHAFVVKTYARTPFHPRDGKGSRLYDADGREYWDLLGGIAVNVLGHKHPAIVKAMREAASSLLHVSNLYYHPQQGILAEELVRASGLMRAFFCNSGTEANEAALKFARLATKKTKLVALEESFHGRSLGALSLTGHEAYRTPFEPLVPGVTFVPANDVAALDAAVDGDTAAIFLEPVMGEGGVIPLDDDFLIAARRIADRAGALLVLDEIQCGLGRTGQLFAFQKSGIVPDIVTLAKPLGGGLPLGAVLTGAALEGAVKPGHHGTTFGGNPVACRLGAVVLAETKKLLPRIQQLGEWFREEASNLTHGVVEVRGSGLMWGIELDRPAAPVARELLGRGFVVGTARDRVLRILPAYNVPKKALKELLVALDAVLREQSGAQKSVSDPAIVTNEVILETNEISALWHHAGGGTNPIAEGAVSK